jgi:hypothetical protein
MLVEMGVDCFHGCEKMANDLTSLKARFGWALSAVKINRGVLRERGACIKQWE